MVLVPRDERPYITFGDVSTYDYECFVDGSKTYNAPERQYEVVEVPGRNGDVHFDNGRYSNVELNFTAYFMDVEEFNDFRDKMVAMIGYQRLEDSHHPDEYRMAVLTGGIEPEVLGEGLTYVQVDLTFTAKPQRFLKSGDNPITFNLTPGVVVDNLLFNNPTQYTSLPLIRVYGTKGGFYCGSGYVNILGGWDSWITIEYIEFDSEILSCYTQYDTNLNNYINGEFPTLYPGVNSFGTWVMDDGNDFTKVVIYPRWWRL